MRKLLAILVSFVFIANVNAQSYRGFVDIFLSTKVNGSNEKDIDASAHYNSPNFMALATTSHGVQINKLFIGGGAGIIFQGDGTYNEQIPIFGDLRWDFFNSHKVNPFLDIKLGYAVSCGQAARAMANSFYYQPSAGIRIRLSQIVGINISLTYYPSKRYIFWQRSKNRTDFSSVTKGFLGLGIGVDF